MDALETHFGEIMALLTGVTWAVAVILFKKSGESVHPIGLNLFKNSLAVILLISTLWIFGQPLLYNASIREYIIVLASGALGIGVADTLFFMSLNKLGAGLSAIVDCTYSPFIIALSIFFLSDSLTFWQVIGVIFIVSAVLTAVSRSDSDQLDRKHIILGVFYGVLAMAVNAVGIVMVKPVLDNSPLIWITTTRLFGGVLVLLLVLVFHRQRKAILASIRTPQSWGYTLAGSIIGAYGAMLLWLAGMKFTQTSIASALNQTSNFFIFIFAALFLKERITPRRLLGIILGVGGAVLVILF